MTLHSGKSQVFFSARELAEMARARGVSGFPHTERRAREYAIREGWTELPEHLCRKRPGRGGGLEFHFSLLPDVLRDTMDGLAVKAHAAQRHEDRALADQAKLDAIRSHSLPPRARATMEARAEILTSIDGYAIANSQKRSWAIGRFLIAQTEYEDRQEIEGRRDCGEFLTPREVESLSYPLTLPAARDAEIAQARVVLVTAQSAAPVPRHLWACVRPKPGTRVVIRLVPGKDALRSVLSIVVTVAAIALGGVLGPTVTGLLGLGEVSAAALVTAGVSIVGQLLINALIPPPTPSSEQTRPSYSLGGWKNRLDPDGAVPEILGTMRTAPPFAARPYTEIVGDDQYMRAIFLLGEGEVSMSDLRLGETSLDEYDEVDVEMRAGLVADLPLSLVPRQIVEEQVGVELTRPLPRDDLGEVIAGDPAIETPVVRTTGADASGASIILAFPAGLARYNDNGARLAHTVKVRIEQREIDADDWVQVEELELTARKGEGFFRDHAWTFPNRARLRLWLCGSKPRIN